MRYRCPDECASVSYAGVLLVRAPDGSIEAAAEAAAALAPHGLVPAEDGDAAKPAPRNGDARMLR